MGLRIYSIPIENVTIGTAVQDIFSILPTNANGTRIHWIHLDASVSAEAALRMRLKRLTGSVSQGSGGTAPTPVIWDAGDSRAAVSTCHINDTSQSTGTSTTLAGFQWDVALPFDFLPPPEHRPTCFPSTMFVLDLPATITSTVISGFVLFEEMP